jgi:hypothetical protein
LRATQAKYLFSYCPFSHRPTWYLLFNKSQQQANTTIMTWELISATPSPYARKVRIALQEKNLPFDLKTEVPWDHTTQTPQYNPLEKLPVLIFNDGRPAVYESHFILEWLETKYPEPSLLPSINEADDRLLVKQIEVVVDGICDALVLSFFENQRDEDKRSKPWTDRYVTLLNSLNRRVILSDNYSAKCAKSKAAYARSTRGSSKGRATTSSKIVSLTPTSPHAVCSDS